MPGLAHYMEQYDHEHASGWNKLLHGVGIPMIFLGLICLIFMKWIWGTSFFVGGWIFLFVGHKIEGNHPAFFSGTDLFAGGTNLGRKGSMGVPDWNAPRAELGGHPARKCDQAVVNNLRVRTNSGNGDGIHGRAKRQSRRRNGGNDV